MKTDTSFHIAWRTKRIGMVIFNLRGNMQKFNYYRTHYPMQLNLRRRMLRKAYVLKTGRGAFPIDWLSWSDYYFRVFLRNFSYKYRNIMLQRKREERHV